MVVLHESCNLFARVAIIQGARDIDLKRFVGSHEMTVVVSSLMKRDVTLLDGFTGKADLVKEVLKATRVEEVPSIQPLFNICVCIDAMYVVNQIASKPSWVKTGTDLAREFTNRIDEQSKDAELVIVAFDSYREESMKSATRAARKTSKVARHFSIEKETNIEKVTMSEILNNDKTKKSLTVLLAEFTEAHLQNRGVDDVVAGSNKPASSLQVDSTNNHEEADRFMINCLHMAPVSQKNVIVHASDTDVSG